jgi:hypothetical protein
MVERRVFLKAERMVCLKVGPKALNSVFRSAGKRAE